MRAIQIREKRVLEEVQLPDPGAPGPGAALVRTRSMGVCGTDIASYLGKFPFFEYPRIPGHELGVEVRAVGEGVNAVKSGDRCSVEPYLHCGICYPCRRGATNCCEQLDVIGVMSDGGLRESFLIPAAKLHPSDSLGFDELALVETLCIGCHAVGRAGVRPENRVLVVGAGPIGLAALEFIRLAGAEVSVLDLNAGRLDFVRENYGISRLIRGGRGEGMLEEILSLTDGDRFDVVFDATGNGGSMAASLDYLAHGGTLVYLGVTSDAVSIPDPVFHRAEATIMGSRNALPGDFRSVIDALEKGRIDSGRWINHRLGFDGVVDGFDEIARPESGVLKAVIEVT